MKHEFGEPLKKGQILVPLDDVSHVYKQPFCVRIKRVNKKKKRVRYEKQVFLYTGRQLVEYHRKLSIIKSGMSIKLHPKCYIYEEDLLCFFKISQYKHPQEYINFLFAKAL